MNESDFPWFVETMDGLCGYYQKDPLPEMAVKIYFRAVAHCSVDAIKAALNKHLQDPKSGQFMPKAADLIKHIDGDEITADMVIAAAKLRSSPFGCMAAMHIGSWDLANLNSFDLKQRAHEVLLLLPEWKAKADQGDYTDHEISIMLKYGISPADPFANGLGRPANASLLEARVQDISRSPRHIALIEPPSSSVVEKDDVMDPELVKHALEVIDNIKSDFDIYDEEESVDER